MTIAAGDYFVVQKASPLYVPWPDYAIRAVACRAGPARSAGDYIVRAQCSDLAVAAMRVRPAWLAGAQMIRTRTSDGEKAGVTGAICHDCDPQLELEYTVTFTDGHPYSPYPDCAVTVTYSNAAVHDVGDSKAGYPCIWAGEYTWPGAPSPTGLFLSYADGPPTYPAAWVVWWGVWLQAPFFWSRADLTLCAPVGAYVMTLPAPPAPPLCAVT